MKRTIKVKESELKKIIAESVKGVLNEQWREFADMGTKDYNEGNNENGSKNWQKARELFKQQYGTDMNSASAECTKNGHWSPGAQAYNKYMSNRKSPVTVVKEDKLANLINKSVKKVLKESFEDDYNTTRQNYNRPLWGFEMKNTRGDWQYGEIEYDPNTQKMSCMGVSIDVDPNLSVDQNLEALYVELMNNGFNDGDD